MREAGRQEGWRHMTLVPACSRFLLPPPPPPLPHSRSSAALSSPANLTTRRERVTGTARGRLRVGGAALHHPARRLSRNGPELAWPRQHTRPAAAGVSCTSLRSSSAATTN
ncbi:hypothetical protein E2C01_042526 [Portunus trituberculatus]|uniref:Uncharacterized protein n=1 Tax=Portunus trituberculatus TaxID=210409 RepID=A0A5B7FUW9_PORTR|nr:hypothetical protein [Portunus trituberculatus]